MSTETKLTSSFTATDQNGENHKIDLFTDFIIISDMSGTERVPGMKSLKMSDGRVVNRVEQGQYETIGIPVLKLTSTDPSAP